VLVLIGKWSSVCRYYQVSMPFPIPRLLNTHILIAFVCTRCLELEEMTAADIRAGLRGRNTGGHSTVRNVESINQVLRRHRCDTVDLGAPGPVVNSVRCSNICFCMSVS
jgi:hypothetical protein